MEIYQQKMTEQYLDIAKVWGVTSLSLIASKTLEVFNTYNEVIQAGLTTLVLVASFVYTIFKIIHVRDSINENKEDEHD